VRRAGRLLLLVLTPLSAILCVATAVFWIRSHFSYDQIGRRTATLAPDQLTHRTFELASVEGRIIVKIETARLTSEYLKHVTADGRQAALSKAESYWRRQDSFAPVWALRSGTILNRLGFACLHTNTSEPFVRSGFLPPLGGPPMFVAIQSRDVRLLLFPHWLPAVACAVAPVLILRKFLRRRCSSSRLARGLCPTCAYDLRHSAGRCPECGHASGKTG
jgi:hypothetical protein